MEHIVNTVKNGWVLSLTVFVVGVLVFRQNLPEPQGEALTSDWLVLGPRLAGSWTPRPASALALEAMDPHGWEPEPEKPPVRPPPPVDPQPVRPPAPTYGVYRVQDRDSYWKISKRLLGAGHRFKEIEALNPRIPPKKLQAGIEIRVPGTGQPRRPGQTNSRPGAREQARPSKPARPTEHRVKKGESLSGIAAHYYTDGSWQRLYNANRDRVRNPDRVRPGVVLRLPDGGRKDLW